MQTDRRGFMWLMAGISGWLAGGGRARAGEPTWSLEIHQQTRNTRLGPVGRNWWPQRQRSRRAKEYPGRERIGLTAPAAPNGRSLGRVLRDFRSADGFANEPLDLPTLSRILHFTNGVTGPPMLRAAPSAGALYAGEIYLLAERIEGLEPGVYYYLPPAHALVPIRKGRWVETVREALERPGEVGKAPAILLLTNVFARYGRRYANRGYRYALIDTGHIGENLRLTARSAGLIESAPLRFHDGRLNQLLGIDGRGEAVCAVHALGRPGEAARAPAVRTFREAENAPADWGATEQYHARSSLVEAEHRAPARPSPLASVVRVAGEATLQPEMSVEQCVRNRRSAHRFEDRLIKRNALEWILDAALGHPALARASELELRLAVHRVADVDRGLYRYEQHGGPLRLLQKRDLRDPLVRTCLGQSKAGSCAAAFFLVGHLRLASETRGSRAYRDLLIEAGAIGQRIYLAAEAIGLAARNLAAFRDDALNHLLELDGREHAVLHLTLVGREG